MVYTTLCYEKNECTLCVETIECHIKMEFMSVAIDRIVYLSLLGLGMYFIYEGDVVYRYRLKKTNFAEKSEPVKELPTILAHIEFKYPFSKVPLICGKDFNISLQVTEETSLNLTSGRFLNEWGKSKIKPQTVEVKWNLTMTQGKDASLRSVQTISEKRYLENRLKTWV